MESNDNLKLEMRLTAIEYLLEKMYATLTKNLSDDEFNQMMDDYIAVLDQQTFPGLDAASSDHMSAEFRDAIVRLLNSVKAIRELGR